MDKTSKTDPNHKYVHFARIVLDGAFPLDMLRYDRCTFLDEADAREAERSIGRLYGEAGEKRVILVQKLWWDKDWSRAWTTGRWESFGCKVLEPIFGVGHEENRKL